MGQKNARKPDPPHAIATIPAVAPSSAFVPLGAVLAGIAAPPREQDGPPCHFCSALCCKYFALEIDRPKTPREHDEVRWYLLHDNVVVWVQEGDWYLEVRARCRHLMSDHTCGIYETRPTICREYGLPSEGACEYFTQDLKYDLYFDSPESFEAWSRLELEKRERRLARRRELRKTSVRSRQPVGV